MKKPIIKFGLTLFAISISILLCTWIIGRNKKIEVSSNPVASTIKNDQPVLNVYIENSGSMDGYMCIGSELKDCVYQLKEIATMAGLQANLTMYVSRHSWASIAKTKNVQLSVIREGIGHDSEATTQIYLASLDKS